MKFDKDSLYKLGKLSKIQIDESKLKSLSSDLGSIIEFIDRLKSIDTENVDPEEIEIEVAIDLIEKKMEKMGKKKKIQKKKSSKK